MVHRARKRPVPLARGRVAPWREEFGGAPLFYTEGAAVAPAHQGAAWQARSVAVQQRPRSHAPPSHPRLRWPTLSTSAVTSWPFSPPCKGGGCCVGCVWSRRSDGGRATRVSALSTPSIAGGEWANVVGDGSQDVGAISRAFFWSEMSPLAMSSLRFTTASSFVIASSCRSLSSSFGFRPGFCG